MQYQDDLIENISKDLERFFGVSGKILKPSPITVAEMIKHVPAGKLITTDILRQELAFDFEVEITDPYETKRALLVISREPNINVPYWRVIKNGGELIVGLPGGFERQAELLTAEGFTIDSNRKTPKVKDYRDSLIHFHTEFQHKSPFAYK